MSVALYFDHQFPVVVSDALRERGFDVLTTQEDGAARFSDDELLRRSTALGRAIVTLDSDFLALAHRWQSTGQEFSGRIFCHTARASVATNICDLELIATALHPEDVARTVLWIPF